jgi:hypothetical protein
VDRTTLRRFKIEEAQNREEVRRFKIDLYHTLKFVVGNKKNDNIL